jgi:hypothetical protein
MNLPSRSQIILSKINEFYRINSLDSHDRIKSAFYELIHQWSEVLAAGNDASDDELFNLNVSRGFLTKIFVIALSKDYFINDHSFTREILRMCLDLLINHIEIFTNKNLTSITTFLISNILLIMNILSNLISFLWYKDIDLFNENDYQLFIVMREYVDQDFKHDNLTDGIISLIWNISDNTSLVPLLLTTDYAKSLIEWIKICRKKFREDQQIALIFILQNMVRHDDGIEQFHLLDTLNIIEQIQIDSDMSLQLSMIRILLTDIKQIKLESMEFLNRLVQLTINAGRNEKYRHDGFHVCEVLTTFTKLFYNDEILNIILSKIETKSSMIELFASLLIKFYPNLSSDNDPLENFTCVLIFNIFWRISYHQEYCQIICDNEQLISIIKSAANNEKNFIDTFMPRTMKSIEQAASEILENFHEKNK